GRQAAAPAGVTDRVATMRCPLARTAGARLAGQATSVLANAAGRVVLRREVRRARSGVRGAARARTAVCVALDLLRQRARVDGEPTP
ncbi:hypothetical protein NL533_32710, partial [Klebsiella pneumoniae]|nr:hypothetical protein [Klebsiella pneumoniae]